MSATPRIGILGAGGRMGRILIQAVHEAGYQLAAAVERPESTLLGADAGELAGIGATGVKVVGSLTDVVKDCDVVIDFTAPAATVNHLKICREAGVAIVIGTTGMNDEQKAYLEQSATETPVVYAANYSVGVNVSIKLLELASKVFGDTVDIEVIEAHHRHKVDAPSGTALMWGEAIAGALGRNLKKCSRTKKMMIKLRGQHVMPDVSARCGICRLCMSSNFSTRTRKKTRLSSARFPVSTWTIGRGRQRKATLRMHSISVLKIRMRATLSRRTAM